MPNYSFIPKLQIRFSFSVHCGSQGGWKYVQSYLWGSLSQQKQRQSSESRKSHSELYSLAKDPCSAIADTTYLNGKYESFWNRKDERTSLWVATVGGGDSAELAWAVWMFGSTLLWHSKPSQWVRVRRPQWIHHPGVWPPVFLHRLQQESGCPCAQKCLP